MALLAAGGRLHTHTCRAWGGNSVAGIYGLGVTANKHTFVRGSGVLLNRAFPKASIPEGHGHPAAWKLPQKPGAISSRFSTILEVGATANGLMGLPGIGSASFAIIVPDAAGGLIASGEGSVTFSITTNTPLLTASLNGIGSATFALTTNTPVLGAEASGIGSTSFTLTASGTIWPIDDTPPARTASATFAINGSLTPYAVGHMIGSALPGDGGITVTVDVAAIADAVWAKVIEGTITAADFQRIFGAALAGEVSGMGTNAPVFRSADGTKDRITATTDASGNRLAVTLDGAP